MRNNIEDAVTNSKNEKNLKEEPLEGIIIPPEKKKKKLERIKTSVMKTNTIKYLSY